jgi:hypothetical protein
VPVGLFAEEHAAALQLANESAVRVLAEDPRKPRDLGGHEPFGVDELQEPEALAFRQAVVVLAERGRDVDKASAEPGVRGRVHRDERRRDDQVAPSAFRGLERQWRKVLSADERLAAKRRGDGDRLQAFSEHFRHQGGRHHESLSSAAIDGDFHADVIALGAHSERDVRRQRPGRGGPREVAHPGLIFRAKADIDARVRHLAVAEADLGGRQRRAALRPPPHDFPILVKEAALE